MIYVLFEDCCIYDESDPVPIFASKDKSVVEKKAS